MQMQKLVRRHAMASFSKKFYLDTSLSLLQQRLVVHRLNLVDKGVWMKIVTILSSWFSPVPTRRPNSPFNIHTTPHLGEQPCHSPLLLWAPLLFWSLHLGPFLAASKTCLLKMSKKDTDIIPNSIQEEAKSFRLCKQIFPQLNAYHFIFFNRLGPMPPSGWRT